MYLFFNKNKKISVSDNSQQILVVKNNFEGGIENYERDFKSGLHTLKKKRAKVY